MKTLVIMGAARKNGHTRQMVDLFLEHLDGEKEIVDAYRTEVQLYKSLRYSRVWTAVSAGRKRSV